MTISVPLQIIDLHGDGYHPLVKVMMDNTQYTLVVDTGASKTAFDHFMLLQSDAGRAIEASERLSAGLGTSSMISATAIIDALDIGDLHISNIEVAVLDLSTINTAYRQLNHPEVLGVLGGDVLMKYNAVIDYEGKILSFHII